MDEVVNTQMLDGTVVCLTKTMNNSILICGLADGVVERRRMSDLSLISWAMVSFQSKRIVELKDGTFMIGGCYGNLERWDECLERPLTTFSGHSMEITKIIELNSTGVIVAGACDRTFRMWTASGECFRTVSIKPPDPSKLCCYSLVKLSSDAFATATGKQIHVWNDKGGCIETLELDKIVSTINKIGYSLVAFSYQAKQISVWRLK